MVGPVLREVACPPEGGGREVGRFWEVGGAPGPAAERPAAGWGGGDGGSMRGMVTGGGWRQAWRSVPDVLTCGGVGRWSTGGSHGPGSQVCQPKIGGAADPAMTVLVGR